MSATYKGLVISIEALAQELTGGELNTHKH